VYVCLFVSPDRTRVSGNTANIFWRCVHKLLNVKEWEGGRKGREMMIERTYRMNEKGIQMRKVMDKGITNLYDTYNNNSNGMRVE
jgi:hypothetical protein